MDSKNEVSNKAFLMAACSLAAAAGLSSCMTEHTIESFRDRSGAVYASRELQSFKMRDAAYSFDTIMRGAGGFIRDVAHAKSMWHRSDQETISGSGEVAAEMEVLAKKANETKTVVAQKKQVVRTQSSHER